MKDTIYAEAIDNIAGFRFDDAVAQVFPDMIQRSVPGYSNIIAMTGLLAARYAQDHSRCYDLGCSLGASILSMQSQLANRPVQFIAVDSSEAMLSRCAAALQSYANIELKCAKLQDVPIEQASVVVLNFTLQFVPLPDRDAVLQRIYDGLLPGGLLILSEKICFDNSVLQSLTTELYHDFKRANGYSDLEISQKRNALEDVLVPETLPVHEQRLRAAGFAHVGVWFQCFNFMSLLAIK